jgi:hypothetical protein
LEEWDYIPHICIVAQPVETALLVASTFADFRIIAVCKNSLLVVPELSNCICIVKPR